MKWFVFCALALCSVLLAQDDYRYDCLATRMDDFATEYNDLAGKLNQGHIDLGQMRTLSDKWRKVERCPMWPE